MKNLNENQKQIVKELKDAFSGMNRKKGVSSGLIDVGLIVNEVSEDLNLVKEIEMVNEAFRKMIKEQIKEDISKIDKDLSLLDLHILNKNIHDRKFYITLEDGMVTNPQYIKIEYKITSEAVSVVGGVKSKLVSFDIYVDDRGGSDTIEELIKKDYFVSKLKRLHKIAVTK